MSILKKIKNWWNSKKCCSTYEEDLEKISKKETKKTIDILKNISSKELYEQLPKNIQKEADECIKQYKEALNNNLPILLIIDDNIGLTSIIADILKIKKIENISVISIHSSYAGFIVNLLAKLNDNKLKIDYAIIDLSYGGVISFEETGNITFEGIMVFKELYDNNPDLKFFFYTGNNLNSYVFSSNKIIKTFKNITNKDIQEFVVFKNKYPPSMLGDVIVSKLFLKEDSK